MTRLKVDVANDVYVGEYYGESVDLLEGHDEKIVKVTKGDGDFTFHRPKHVESIELVDD